ncbi:uncharacterized protein LOC130902091 [Diorhabda carinulata]|uniref:uncharacterized protein LOC130902091 n=1 Tax=Diorhabda carinulata TaxID=1163345 RepID=UPI0025A0CDD0|nr:uncharacterized protein LOC130902091 [Diorhabda carinulata]
MQENFCLISSYSRSPTYRHCSMNTKKNKHFSTQTSSELPYQSNVSLDEENVLTYKSAINYINKYHELMNNILSETRAKCDIEDFKFKFPEIPNYANLLPCIVRWMCPVKDNLIQETKKSYSVIDILPELKLLSRKFSSELNMIDYEAELTKLLQNKSTNSVVRNVSPKYKISSKSEKFQTCRLSVEADKNLEAKTKTFNIFSKNRTISVDTQVSRKKVKLVKSCFNIVNIAPYRNLMNYLQTNNVNKSYIFNEEKVHDKNIIPIDDSVNVKPTTLKRVKKMFDVISKEGNNIKSVSSKATSITNRSVTYEETSDTDSVIFDDEQFEQMHQNSKSKQIKGHEERQVNTNPFQLNSKELTHVNGETLSAIGLFTDRGDIRPDIMNILKTKKEQKSTDMRNKQFRTKRQWDFQIHLNPRNDFGDSVASVSSDVLSYPSDLKLHIDNVNSQYRVL